jgi:signal transduction histidine kinase
MSSTGSLLCSSISFAASSRSGAGIDPKNMDRIFDAFFTTKARGMGMGLSICRSIIEAHGGRLWASHGTTHGTIFYITLPIRGSDVLAKLWKAVPQLSQLFTRAQ